MVTASPLPPKVAGEGSPLGGPSGEEVDAQFVQSAAVGVDYWRQRLQDADGASLGSLGRERRNILRAIKFGLRLPQTLEAAAALTLETLPIVRDGGYWQEWTPIFEWAASLVAGANGGLERRLWNRVGQLYQAARRLEEAAAVHHWVAQAAREADDEQAEAEALFRLGEDYREKRDYERAQGYAEQALQRFEALDGERKWTAGTLNTLGLVAWRRGEREEAEALLRQASDEWRALQDPTELGRVLGNLGGVLRERELFDEALQVYEEARSVLEGTASRIDKVIANVALGSLYYEQEQYAAAEEAFRAADAPYSADAPYLRRTGHSYYQAYVANGLGNVFLRQGKLEAAEARLRRAVALWQEADDELMRANSMRSLARVLAARGRAQEAVAQYDEALAIATRYKDDAWARKLVGEIREERERTAADAEST